MDIYGFYKKRAYSIKDAEFRRVALIMCEHIGEKNSIRKEVVQSLAGLGNERNVRDMFEILTITYKFPVCAHSGKAGYFVPEKKSATSRTRAEIRSRGEKMFAKDRAYDLCVYPPEDVTEIHEVEFECQEQPALFEVEEEPRDYYFNWGR